MQQVRHYKNDFLRNLLNKNNWKKDLDKQKPWKAIIYTILNVVKRSQTFAWNEINFNMPELYLLWFKSVFIIKHF